MNLGRIGPSRSPYKAIFIFGIISFLILIFVFYTSFSKAKIILNLRKEKIETNFEIAVGKDKINATSVSGRFIEKEISGSDETSEIKSKTVDDFATGKVTIYNKQTKSLTLLASSQLKPVDSDIIFKTTGPLVLKPNDKVEMKIVATQKGVAGNLAPTKFNFVKLWDGWKNLVYAENKQEFTGGEKTGKIVSEEDLNNLRVKISDSLFAKFLDDTKNEQKENEELWDQLFKKEISSFKSSVDANTEADSLKADLKLKITGVILNKEMLENLAIAKLKDQIIGEKEFSELDDENFKAEIIEIDPKKNQAVFKIYCSAFLKPVLAKEALDKEKITGFNNDEVKTYYNKYKEDIETVEVYFSPFWQKTVPSGNTEITVK
ncbi:MAG: hypothetical protein WC663_01670 [Patescibacteria group bacterium]|jgi:hypothetical protein